MCGIAAYIGEDSALDYVLEGLTRLEYRGYDSAGVAVATPDGAFRVAKAAGGLDRLRAALAADRPLEGSIGIGHTRWATHGGPNTKNAHPHVSADGKLALVHNGIIENAAALRAELEDAGITFASETDTEVAAQLLALIVADIEDETEDALAAGMSIVASRLQGTFALVAMHADFPGQLVAVRRGSPLVLGLGDNVVFVASDVTAFLAHTRSVLEPEEDQVVTVRAGGVQLTDLHGHTALGRTFQVDWDVEAAERGGYETFMDKEIAEQPAAVADTLRGHFDGSRVLLDEQQLGDEDLRGVDKVFVVACGSAYHSGLVAKYAIEHWAQLPVEVELASEFRYRDPVLHRDTLVIAVSQSGETMDTLQALRHAKRQKARVLAVCNTNGAQIPRESDAVLYTHAGPEIGVAATKSFLSQVTANYLVGLALAQARGTRTPDEIATVVEGLAKAPAAITKVLEGMDAVRSLGRELASAPAVLFLGRHVGFPIALEGALKLKELAYMHAEGFAAGELKHGPIALVEQGLPVVAIMPTLNGNPEVHSKMVSNIREVQARGAKVIVLADFEDAVAASHAEHFVPLPPLPPLLQPLVSTIPLQVLAAEIARGRGFDIDKPRNLAKSVTVE